MTRLFNVEKTFNQRAEKYESAYVSGADYLLYQEKQLRAQFALEWAARFLKDRTSARVLDVGCGLGNVLRAILNEGESTASGLGIDVSQRMIERARVETEQQDDSRVEFRVGIVEDESEKFDLVLSLGVVGYQEEQLLFLRNLAQRVKPGGLLIITVGNGDSWVRAFRTKLQTIKHRNKPQLLRYGALEGEQVEQELRASGFERAYRNYLSFGLGVATSSLECRMDRFLVERLGPHSLGRLFSLTVAAAYRQTGDATS
jgi:2-polyprenyl-3-methyl-5-hydroxy-6-metoxy-1,4-benzoquinol methylase